MIFLALYPALFLLFMRAMGLAHFRNMRSLLQISVAMILPVIPFLWILMRYYYRNIDYLSLGNNILFFALYTVLLPFAMFYFFCRFLRSFTWWTAQDMVIVAMLVESIVNVSNIVMGFSFFSYGDELIVPVVRMGNMQILLSCILLGSMSKKEKIKIADNSSQKPMKLSQKFSSPRIFIKEFWPILLFASIVISFFAIRLSKQGFYLEAYIVTALSIILGWGSILVLRYGGVARAQ